MHRPVFMKSYRGIHRRFLATKPQPPPKEMTSMTDGGKGREALPPPKEMNDGGEDFRPPWVYVGSRLVNYVIVPGILLSSYMKLANFKLFTSGWILLRLLLRLR
jgi:hypothetical protein